jgi:chromatin assembly factor 1 subunit A
MSSPTSTSVIPAKRKPAAVPVPKTPFPDALLPLLADKIASLATGSLNLLIESAYQDLRAHSGNANGASAGTPGTNAGHKVTKVAVEAKVREIGEKCRTKKVWVVKEDVLVSILSSHASP